MSNWQRCVSDGHQRSSLVQEKHTVLFLKNLQTQPPSLYYSRENYTSQWWQHIKAYIRTPTNWTRRNLQLLKKGLSCRKLLSLLISGVLRWWHKSLGLFVSQISDAHVLHKAGCQIFNSLVLCDCSTKNWKAETESWHWRLSQIPSLVVVYCQSKVVFFSFCFVLYRGKVNERQQLSL